MAAAMGVELLTEEEYQELQKLGDFDTKTSSWVKTPPDIRKLGGALYCDRRYGRVFVGHNSAESYYSGRGLRLRLADLFDIRWEQAKDLSQKAKNLSSINLPSIQNRWV